MLNRSNDIFMFKKSNFLLNLPAVSHLPTASVCFTLVFSWVLVAGLGVLKLLVKIKEDKSVKIVFKLNLMSWTREEFFGKSEELTASSPS